MLTFVQLRCFSAVAEELNIRRAARRLGMTQPPLTRHIQALEHQVGTELLDRSGRSVTLTAAGTRFAHAARRLMDQATEAVTEARQIAAGDVGTLSIAFTAASSYGFVPNLIAAICQGFPGLSLTLREMTTPQQIAALKAQQVDLCLLRPPVSLPGVQTRRVYRERLVLAVPDGHRLAGRASAGIDDVAGETLITYPPVEGPYFHGLVMGLLHAAGVQPRSIQHVTQTHSMLALVGAGLGVAVVPQAAERWRPPGVHLLALAGAEGLNADLLLAWRRSTPNPAAHAVLGLVAELPAVSSMEPPNTRRLARGIAHLP